MKSILFALFFLLTFTGLAFGAYLVCDPYPTSVTQPTNFHIYMDGATTPIESPAFKNPDNSVQLKHDLSSVTVGQHTVQVSAVIEDVWGISETTRTPFTYTKRDVNIKPNAPTGLGLAL